jgi:drug/metabolite transporter (DMT)-like permease
MKCKLHLRNLAEKMAWIGSWFFLNVAVTIMNKLFFHMFEFSFPVLISCSHMAVTCVFSYITVRKSKLITAPIQRPQKKNLLLFSVLFMFNILTGNFGLKYVSVSLVQVVRSTIPGITIALSILILGKHYSLKHYLSIFLVVVGVVLASLGEVEFHTIGFIAVVLVCFLSALKSVLSNKFLVGAMSFHPFVLLYYMSSYSFIQLYFISIIIGEFQDAISWWSVNGSMGLICFLLVNSIFAFLLNVSNFYTNQKTSALTVTVIGNIKHIVTIVLSIIIFGTPLTLLNITGTAITVIGAFIYSLVELNK